MPESSEVGTIRTLHNPTPRSKNSAQVGNRGQRRTASVYGEIGPGGNHGERSPCPQFCEVVTV
jgi:hypothetical protein